MKFFSFLGTALLATVAAAESSVAPPNKAFTSPNPLAARQTICEKPTGVCGFYQFCLENKYRCGQSGYPLGYGEKYCDAFTANRNKFSADRGRAWVDKTMLCLQQRLVPEATVLQSTCSAVKDKAFGVHASCYINGGMCGLYATDWLLIMKTVDIRDLFGKPESWVQILQTTAGCASLYKWMIDNNLCKAVKNVWEWAKGTWSQIVNNIKN